MAPIEYNASFSGAYNYGLQAGYIAGNVEAHYYHVAGKFPFLLLHHSRMVLTTGSFVERPETPPAPSLSIPFLRDVDFVDRTTILNQLRDRCAVPGSSRFG